MQTSVSIDIEAPIEDVWAEAVDFPSHAEWMSDAADIGFETDQTTGVGTVLLVETKVGPLRTLDRFTITAIEPPHIVRGEHDGAVTGKATWTITENDGVTTFLWEENLRFPWFFGWRLGEIIARPIFHVLWKQNLRRLKERIEGRS